MASKEYTYDAATALLRSYGFNFYTCYTNTITKTEISIWISKERKPCYLHILSDQSCFFTKPINSHNSVLKYLREME